MCVFWGECLRSFVEDIAGDRDEVFIGKTNGSSCRKSRPKPFIQIHSSTRDTAGASFLYVNRMIAFSFFVSGCWMVWYSSKFIVYA